MNNTTVYMLHLFVPYEGSTVFGIFSTLEKAQAAQANMCDFHRGDMDITPLPFDKLNDEWCSTCNDRAGYTPPHSGRIDE